MYFCPKLFLSIFLLNPHKNYHFRDETYLEKLG